jgi:hypothetical protein
MGIISVNFYSGGTDEYLKALTCSSTSYNLDFNGDPGNPNPTFCELDELLSCDITPFESQIAVGQEFYLSSGGQIRKFIRTFAAPIAYQNDSFAGGCQACPEVSPYCYTISGTTSISVTPTTNTTYSIASVTDISGAGIVNPLTAIVSVNPLTAISVQPITTVTST